MISSEIILGIVSFLLLLVASLSNVVVKRELIRSENVILEEKEVLGANAIHSELHEENNSKYN